jgi:sugar lactone lactonase YvrE
MDESGWRWSHALDAYGFVTALPGQRVYVVSNAENRTYGSTDRPDGTLDGLEPFAERGGEAVAVDSEGNVYIANGQVFVYASSGALIGQIDLPQRPTALAFGGPDRHTLFVLTHHALYAVKTRNAGESSR